MQQVQGSYHIEEFLPTADFQGVADFPEVTAARSHFGSSRHFGSIGRRDAPPGVHRAEALCLLVSRVRPPLGSAARRRARAAAAAVITEERDRSKTPPPLRIWVEPVSEPEPEPEPEPEFESDSTPRSQSSQATTAYSPAGTSAAQLGPLRIRLPPPLPDGRASDDAEEQEPGATCP